MRPEVKERVYLLVIIFSFLMCGAMIITMLSGNRPEQIEEHIPVVRNIKDTEDVESVDSSDKTDFSQSNNKSAYNQMEITEEYINDRLMDLLPSGFPLKNGAVRICDGMMILEGKTEKQELIDYLQKKDNSGGVKYSVALLFLPDELALEAVFGVNRGSGGSTELVTRSFALSGKEIGADMLPANMSEGISKAVNKVIRSINEDYRLSGLKNGAVLLEKI